MEIWARRPAGLVGTVSHRPFSGLPGEVGMARGTRALPGGGSGLGPLVEIWARRPVGLVGTVSHRPFPESSGPWAIGRGGDGPWDTGPTGRGSGLVPLVEIWARRPVGLVGTVSHRPFPGLPGKKMAEELDYVPMPDQTTDFIRKNVFTKVVTK